MNFPSNPSQPSMERVLAAGLGALGTLPDAERPDAERLLQLVEGHFLATRDPENENIPLDQTKREAVRLVEILARRSAAAMPYAALGRALLASAHGDESAARALSNEFLTKLSMLGL